jgi:hypothetical protein
MFNLFKKWRPKAPEYKAPPCPPKPEPIDDGWVRFVDEKPPHEVVLVACDTYDCGWVVESAWWYEDKKCWMSTCSPSHALHLPFSHWRLL